MFPLAEIDSYRLKGGWNARVRLTRTSGDTVELKGLASAPSQEVVDFAIRRAREAG